MKPATSGPPTPWHQDEAFRDPCYDYREVSVWLALQPVNRQNGCMEFISGSNRGDLLPHRPLGGDPTVHALECYTGFDPAMAVPCPLPAGGCTIHTGRTLHYAGSNVSGQARYAYGLIFSAPPVPAREVRSFPWLAARDTRHEQRARAWRAQGGLGVETVRWMRKLDFGDRDWLSYEVGRAISAAKRRLRPQR
ncbi:MAG TPA: phytanoyl-CoA dioxygenase family protein [Acetobacteraceae bacterium]|nr:phytanoyl-CoA dioxygenase family protein [Acetobacteraceae bacterium]